MCALAEAFVHAGLEITGCDLRPGTGATALEELGVPVAQGHDPGHLDGASALVVTSAVPSTHPELEEARRRDLPVFRRAEALGEWVSSGTVVAVSGTHGKTTTSALVAHVLEAGGLDPTAFVGGRNLRWGGNLRVGGDELFVVEADEFDRSFLALDPDVAVVTNLEADHLDVYGDLSGVRDGFRSFLDRTREGGTVVACADDPEVGRLLPGLPFQVTTYGFSAGTQLRGTGVEADAFSSRVRVWEEGVDRGGITVPAPGLHNVRNALAAAAVGRTFGVSWDQIRDGIAGFQGVGRRFQRLGEAEGVVVVDDYAHHPTEVEAALEAARSAFPHRRIVAVFQPHLYTRTRDFLEAFGGALAAADRIWVTDVYPAREEPIPGVDGQAVAEAVKAAGGKDVTFHGEVGTLPEALVAQLEEGDLCLTLGAGSVEAVGPEVVARLKGRGGDHA